MFKTFIAGIGIVLVASTLWVPALVYGWGGTLTLSFNSIHCTDLISGGTRQTVADGAASCSINIKEIATACVNKAGNSDSSSSHIFLLNGVPISESSSGETWPPLTKNGDTLADIFFSPAEIQTALGNQFPSLDPAVLCPNKNWKLKWAVSKFDMVATVNNVQNGYQPFFPALTPTTAFASCNPAISGLTYSNDGGTNRNLAAGILSECWLFRNQSVNVDGNFIGADLGGVAFLDTNFTPGAFYNGVCQEHGKQNGSLGNVGAFNLLGPNPLDLECTGGDQVLDGTY